MDTPKNITTVAVSGGFDPIHIGHVRMFEEAKKLGDKLVVILNNDNWLKKKKGYVFMPQDERAEVIRALRAVDEVVISSHEEDPQDMSVCADLRMLKPNIFANGGDRNEADAANPESTLYREMQLGDELGIKRVFNLGHGGKIQSSSWLVDNYRKIKNTPESL